MADALKAGFVTHQNKPIPKDVVDLPKLLLLINIIVSNHIVGNFHLVFHGNEKTIELLHENGEITYTPVTKPEHLDPLKEK